MYFCCVHTSFWSVPFEWMDIILLPSPAFLQSELKRDLESNNNKYRLLRDYRHCCLSSIELLTGFAETELTYFVYELHVQFCICYRPKLCGQNTFNVMVSSKMHENNTYNVNLYTYTQHGKSNKLFKHVSKLGEI
jgi:hypothetical protein